VEGQLGLADRLAWQGLRRICHAKAFVEVALVILYIILYRTPNHPTRFVSVFPTLLNERKPQSVVFIYSRVHSFNFGFLFHFFFLRPSTDGVRLVKMAQTASFFLEGL